MTAFEWACLAVIWTVALVSAVAAIFRGWVAPWLRGRVLSPRLWGIGIIVMGLGLTVEMSSAHWLRWHWSADAATPVLIVGFCIFLSGLGLMAWAQRAGRAVWPSWIRKY